MTIRTGVVAFDAFTLGLLLGGNLRAFVAAFMVRPLVVLWRRPR